ncbi:hypothetical protein AMECASPLE_000840 [Ameca splendens]|uniref:Uncharacterized protein n=1 Tax=Ameca splendens TaxID=208324 RepID=A0ABV0XXW5_9TELE
MGFISFLNTHAHTKQQRERKRERERGRDIPLVPSNLALKHFGFKSLSCSWSVCLSDTNKHTRAMHKAEAHREWRDGASLCVFTSPVILVNYACRDSLLGRWSGLGGIVRARKLTLAQPITRIHPKSHTSPPLERHDPARHTFTKAQLTCSSTT